MADWAMSRIYLDRLDRVRKAMADQGVDVLLLSVGHDLPYLTGYEAMPLERLTMLVVPRDGDATMVIPRLEAPRVVEQPGVFTLLPWDETEDPTAIVADLAGRRDDGRRRRPDVGPLPRRAAAAAAGHRVPPGRRRRRPAADGQGRRRDRRPARPPAPPPTGSPTSSTPARSRSSGAPRPQVSADISARLIAEGHDKVNFAIVAAGENAASPHHHAGDRVIARRRDRAVRLRRHDGRLLQRHTRCVFTGEPPAEIAEAYAVLHEAQQASVAAAIVGTPCEDVDRAARRDHRRRRLRRATSSTAPATASAWRSTRTRTSSRATTGRSSPATPSASSPASTCRPVGDAPRGHRRRHRRRARCRSTPPTTRLVERLTRARRSGARPVLRASDSARRASVAYAVSSIADVGGVEAGQRAARRARSTSSVPPVTGTDDARRRPGRRSSRSTPSSAPTRAAASRRRRVAALGAVEVGRQLGVADPAGVDRVAARRRCRARTSPSIAPSMRKRTSPTVIERRSAPACTTVAGVRRSPNLVSTS